MFWKRISETQQKTYPSSSVIFLSLSFFSFSISRRISSRRSTSACAFPESSLWRATSCSRLLMRSASSVLAWASRAAFWAWKWVSRGKNRMLCVFAAACYVIIIWNNILTRAKTVFLNGMPSARWPSYSLKVVIQFETLLSLLLKGDLQTFKFGVLFQTRGGQWWRMLLQVQNRCLSPQTKAETKHFHLIKHSEHNS